MSRTPQRPRARLAVAATVVGALALTLLTSTAGPAPSAAADGPSPYTTIPTTTTSLPPGVAVAATTFPTLPLHSNPAAGFLSLATIGGYATPDITLPACALRTSTSNEVYVAQSDYAGATRTTADNTDIGSRAVLAAVRADFKARAVSAIAEPSNPLQYVDVYASGADLAALRTLYDTCKLPVRLYDTTGPAASALAAEARFRSLAGFDTGDIDTRDLLVIAAEVTRSRLLLSFDETAMFTEDQWSWLTTIGVEFPGVVQVQAIPGFESAVCGQFTDGLGGPLTGYGCDDGVRSGTLSAFDVPGRTGFGSSGKCSTAATVVRGGQALVSTAAHCTWAPITGGPGDRANWDDYGYQGDIYGQEAPPNELRTNLIIVNDNSEVDGLPYLRDIGYIAPNGELPVRPNEIVEWTSITAPPIATRRVVRTTVPQEFGGLTVCYTGGVSGTNCGTMTTPSVTANKEMNNEGVEKAASLPETFGIIKFSGPNPIRKGDSGSLVYARIGTDRAVAIGVLTGTIQGTGTFAPYQASNIVKLNPQSGSDPDGFAAEGPVLAPPGVTSGAIPLGANTAKFSYGGARVFKVGPQPNYTENIGGTGSAIALGTNLASITPASVYQVYTGDGRYRLDIEQPIPTVYSVAASSTLRVENVVYCSLTAGGNIYTQRTELSRISTTYSVASNSGLTKTAESQVNPSGRGCSRPELRTYLTLTRAGWVYRNFNASEPALATEFLSWGERAGSADFALGLGSGGGRTTLTGASGSLDFGPADQLDTSGSLSLSIGGTSGNSVLVGGSISGGTITVSVRNPAPNGNEWPYVLGYVGCGFDAAYTGFGFTRTDVLAMQFVNTTGGSTNTKSYTPCPGGRVLWAFLTRYGQNSSGQPQFTIADNYTWANPYWLSDPANGQSPGPAQLVGGSVQFNASPVSITESVISATRANYAVTGTPTIQPPSQARQFLGYVAVLCRKDGAGNLNYSTLPSPMQPGASTSSPTAISPAFEDLAIAWWGLSRKGGVTPDSVGYWRADYDKPCSEVEVVSWKVGAQDQAGNFYTKYGTTDRPYGTYPVLDNYGGDGVVTSLGTRRI